jgi:hypothetical protein
MWIKMGPRFLYFISGSKAIIKLNLNRRWDMVRIIMSINLSHMIQCRLGDVVLFPCPDPRHVGELREGPIPHLSPRYKTWSAMIAPQHRMLLQAGMIFIGYLMITDVAYGYVNFNLLIFFQFLCRSNKDNPWEYFSLRNQELPFRSWICIMTI